MVFGRKKRKVEEEVKPRGYTYYPSRSSPTLDKINREREGQRNSLIRKVTEEIGLIQDYQQVDVELTNELIMPGQMRTHMRLADISAEEVQCVVDKLDYLLVKYPNEEIRLLVLKNFESILNLVRIVKRETRLPFLGVRGIGGELDMRWLEPYDVGEKILNSDKDANRFLYGGSEKAFSWHHAFHVGTKDTMIPEQVMRDSAGIIHLGLVERENEVKIGYASWILSGVRIVKHPTLFKSYAGLQIMEWDYPIIVLPERKQGLELVPSNTGSSRLEMLSLLVLTADSNTEL